MKTIAVNCAYDEMVPIERVIPNPRNPNTHPEEQIRLLSKIIDYQGWRNPIVVSTRSGFIVKGHARLIAAQNLGLQEVPIDYQDYDSEAQEWSDLLADNRLAELAVRDNPALKDLLEDLDVANWDIELTGYTSNAVEVLMTQFNVPREGLTEPDSIPTVTKLITAPGDLWILGDHRVLCGDATSRDDIDRLMDGAMVDMIWTDPPYGVSYRGTNNPNGRPWDIIEGDKLRGEDLQDLLRPAMTNAARVLKEAGAAYVMYASINHTNFEQAIKDACLQVRQQLIWYKHMVLGHSDYHWTHEPILYCSKEGRATWYGDRTAKTLILNSNEPDLTKLTKAELVQIITTLKDQATIIEASKDPANEYLHPTQKPVELICKCLVNSSPVNGKVLDPFAGAGGTVMACERLSRSCYATEIDPHYCDVIVKRWELYTGREATRHGP